MKIMLPVHHFPPQRSAGAELYTLRLARWLAQHGHDVDVVCVEAIDHGAPGELDVSHDEYAGVPVWRLRFNMAHADDAMRWSYRNPLLRRWFDQFLQRAAPDLIHVQAGYLIGIVPLEAAADAGIPTILTLHDYWFLCPRITLQRGDGSLCTKIPDEPAGCAWCMRLDSRRYRLPDRFTNGAVGMVAQRGMLAHDGEQIAARRAALRAALALPQAVMAPSHFLAGQFAAHVAPDRLVVSRYGLDLTPFANAPQPRKDGVLRIGYIGQIAPHKGVHVLIDAFRQLQQGGRASELHIYGGLDAQPRYVQRLRRLAENDPRIHLHGGFPNNQVAGILGKLDVTVVPSQWYENSPLAIMEAHAAGTPVITAALGGMAELVRSGVDGLHFEAGNAVDLARQLQRLLDDPALLPRLRAGVQPPRSIADEMTQLMTIYEQILAATPVGVED